MTDYLRALQTKLDALPPAYDESPQANLLALCAAFLHDIDNYTNGKPQYDPGQHAFLQDAFIHYQSLKAEIIETKPDFLVVPVSTHEPPVVCVPSPPSLVIQPCFELDFVQSDLSRSSSSQSEEGKLLKKTKSASTSTKSAKKGRTHSFTHLTSRNFFTGCSGQDT
jgi:hypothetical protein